jgi:hypothetical protein
MSEYFINLHNNVIDHETKRGVELDKKIEKIKENLISKLRIKEFPLDQYGLDDLSELTIKFWEDATIAVFEKKYDNYIHKLPWEYFKNYDLYVLEYKLQELKEKNNLNQRIVTIAKSELNLC